MVIYKLLIVEDDLIAALPLIDFFEEQGFEVRYVITGEEAVKVYIKERPSIVLLDVKLPGIDGFEVIEKFWEKDNRTPVIMMTGSEVQTEQQVRGYRLGAVYYLQKPVTPEVVLAQINQLLNPPETQKYYLNGYDISLQLLGIRINNDEYELRERDARILSQLLRKPNEVIVRQDLYLPEWSKNNRDYLNNWLDSSISRINKILKKYPGLKIKNVYNQGYKIDSTSVVEET